MKRIRAVLVACVVTFGLVAGQGLSPADAAAKKRFKYVSVFGAYADSEPLGPPFVRVCLGYHVYEGATDKVCYGYMGSTGFKPSVTRYKVDLRWYAGTKVFRTTSKIIRKNRGAYYFHLPKSRHLTNSGPGAPGGNWRYKGKKISVRVAISKSGYHTKRVVIRNSDFSGCDDC